MKAPNEFIEKVERYKRLHREAEDIFAELTKWVQENGGDGCYINEFTIYDEPSGCIQERGDDGRPEEYCEQSRGYCEDDYYGTYFHKVEKSTKWFGYSYNC